MMADAGKMKPLSIFRLVDKEGRPIGQVVQPTSARILGCGAGTVLLVRDRMPPEVCRVRACA
jgi:hypothetical protein